MWMMQGNEMTDTRLRFLKRMLAIYFAIVGGSTLIAVTRFSLGEDGSLHHFISTTSNHLVLARISASLLSWGGYSSNNLSGLGFWRFSECHLITHEGESPLDNYKDESGIVIAWCESISGVRVSNHVCRSRLQILSAPPFIVAWDHIWNTWLQ